MVARPISDNSVTALSPFDPMRIGPLQLRNRFIKSATNEGMAKGGTPSKGLVEHHRRMAAGGAAMTTVAYCAVSPDSRTFVDQLTLDATSLPHLKVLTEAVHREGAAASAQITHGGAFNFLPRLSTRYPRSASGGFNPPGVINGRLVKVPMTEAELERVADEFVLAALRARDAGFDAVELHMGRALIHEPQLVNQFRKGTATVSGCTACNQCVAMMYTPGGTRCVLHPPNDVQLNQTPAAA